MQKVWKTGLALFLLAFFCVLWTGRAQNLSRYHDYQKMTLDHSMYRRLFFSEEMLEAEEYLSKDCKKLQKNVRKEAEYFPVPESSEDNSLTISYVDSWQAERNYNGEHTHEGTDIMAGENIRGLYPIVSITDGTVANLGWLELGGYRIGIVSESGTYYYYAHLESYADIQEGDEVKAGQLLGYMGDSGYGSEGTTGKFAVHLHLGIYIYENGQEISVNPYYVLRYLENKKLKYAYS